MNKLVKYSILIFLSVLLMMLFAPPNSVQAYSLVQYDGQLMKICNKASGKYLNVNNATDANGTNVNQWSADGSLEQQFRVSYYSSNGTYRFFAMCSDKGAGRVLDVYKSNGNIQSGCNVDIWSTGDDACQFFNIYRVSNEYYSIRLHSNRTLALTAYGTGNGSGAGNTSTSNGNVYVSTYTGSDNQLWKFEAYSTTPAVPYRNYRGLSGTYYIDDTCSGYNNYIQQGLNNWGSTLSLSRAYDNTSTSVDFYGKPQYVYQNDDNEIWLGQTLKFVGANGIDGHYNNWAYSEIELNLDFYADSTRTTEQKNVVVSHEVGHAYGLTHYEVNNTIMRSNIDDMSVFTPTSLDKLGIQTKY